MSTPKFAYVHNLVAFLSEPTESKGFEQIIDFLNVNPIKYALMVNPTIYTSCIEQFWATAMAKNIIGEAQIHGKVDGKKVIISEVTIRRDLKFEDEGGIECLSNEVIFEQLPLIGVPKETVVDEAVNKEMYDSLVRATTTATRLDAEQDRGNISKTQSKATPNEPSSPRTSSGGGPRRQDTTRDTFAQARSENVSKQSNDPYISRVNTLRSGEDRLKLKELIEICTNLQQRVIDLENTKTDASKQRRNIIDIDAYAKTTLVDEIVEDQGRYDDQEMFDTSVLDDEEEVLLKQAQDVQNVVKKPDELTMAQALVKIKKSKPMGETKTTTTVTIPTPDSRRPKARGVVMQEPKPLKMKKKDQISFDEQEARRLQAEFDEQDRLAEEKAQLIEDENLAWDNVQAMMDADYELAASQLKNKSFNEVQKAFDKTINWINSFLPMDSEVVKDKAELTQEINSKRAGDELDQERSKKQKVEDDKEFKELKRCLEIIPDDGDDVTIDATPLSIKTLIIDYKIYKEEKKSYFQIFRADGNSHMYYTFSKMLKNFNREDLEVLWRLLKIENMIVAGADNHTFMLEKSMYNSWKSHMKLYIRGKEHDKDLIDSVLKGPFKYGIVVEDGIPRTKTYEELTDKEKIYEEYDIRATNIVLQCLPLYVYNLVNHHTVAKEMWDRVKLLMDGT
nr:hypothetical protein [Tanacetum cinerariifolium]